MGLTEKGKVGVISIMVATDVETAGGVGIPIVRDMKVANRKQHPQEQGRLMVKQLCSNYVIKINQE